MGEHGNSFDRLTAATVCILSQHFFNFLFHFFSEDFKKLQMAISLSTLLASTELQLIFVVRFLTLPGVVLLGWSRMKKL